MNAVLWYCNIAVMVVSILNGTYYATQAKQPSLHAHDYCLYAKEKMEAGEYGRAIELLHIALSIEPHNSRTHFYLANAFFHEQRYEDAREHYEQVAKLIPDNVDLCCNLGICSNLLSEYSTAIGYFTKAITLDPLCKLAHRQRIASCEQAQNFATAALYCTQALTQWPDDADFLLQCGIILKKLERYEEAEQYYRKLYEIQPHNFQTIIELAAILNSMEKYEESLELYYKALAIKPDSYGTLYNCGYTLKKLGHIDYAIALYKQVIKLKHDYPLAHFGLGLAYLTKGDFERGFFEYEWRWQAYNEPQRSFTIPTWDGSSLENKRIYVYAEQGYGDTFQFMRYLQLLKTAGAYIIFCPQTALIPFMKLCPYIDRVVSIKDPVPSCNYTVPLLSLPLLCKTTVNTVPATIPYVYADTDLVTEWSSYFADAAPLKIGICWHGNSQYTAAALRRIVAQKSIPVALFQSLANIPGVQLYSLQKISGLDQLSICDERHFLTLFPDDIDTMNGRFMDTAAIITQLDLVISVDTSIAHLAAALGTPTWIVLPNPADWRWMLDRTDTPWYPNVRLFRQPTPGDWHTVVRDVADALHEMVNKENKGN